MLNFYFAKSPEIHFGPHKSNMLGKLVKRYGDAVLVITGSKSLQESGMWELITQQLKLENIRYFHVPLQGEPSPTFVDNICSVYRGKGINAVIAIGGGSVVDAGKAISAMLPQNDSVFSYLEGIGKKVHDGRKIPFIAVPTTSGTGSETTKNAVLSQVGSDGFKKSIRHDHFVPDIAVIDPTLTFSLPAHITAACGMDAFTQLLESYVSTGASWMTDSLAFDAMHKIRDSLVQACTTHSKDMEVRSKMAYASMISGITLANAGLGVVHGFASVIGGYFYIPHSIICGRLMGPATRANIEKLANENPEDPAFKKYARIGKMMVHGCEHNDELYAYKLAEVIEEWTDKLAVPLLSSFGVTEKDADKIVKETGQKNNPVKLNTSDLHKILELSL
jgi:alcohol dehydrogenase class IV